MNFFSDKLSDFFSRFFEAIFKKKCASSFQAEWGASVAYDVPLGDVRVCVTFIEATCGAR